MAIIKKIEKNKSEKIEKPKKLESKKKKVVFVKKKTDDEKPRRRRKRSIAGAIINFFLSLLMLIGIAAMIGVIGFCGYIVATAPEFDTDKLYNKEASIFYYKSGEEWVEFARVGMEQREHKNYDDLPDVFVDALIATEDARFFQHNGFDVVRFTKAAMGQVSGQEGAGGASTLTMQVAKNTFSKDDEGKIASHGFEGIVRKFHDIYVAIFLIEKNYTKEEIVEFYANAQFLGQNTYGVEQASQKYFGKSISDLTLTEAALLVGIFNSPSKYNPFYSVDAAQQRRDRVLDLMVRHDYITEEQANDAKAIPVASLIVERKASTLNKYQQFIDLVCEQMEEEFGDGINPYSVSTDVYTTMDPNIQQMWTDLNEGNLGYKWKTYKYNDYQDIIQIGGVITNVHDGSIAGVDGGRHQTAEREYNRAIQMKTQPGSTAKPIFAYGPYIEFNNGNTGTVFYDNKMTYSNGQPLTNADNTYHGAMTMRQALAQSRNIPAVQAFQAVDKQKAAEFIHNCGIDYGDTLYESHAIGGGLEVSPLDMAGAYGTFARGGYYIKPYSYTKIVFKETDEVYEKKVERIQAMSEETAYMITDILMTATKQGAGGNINVPGTEIASKTGTATYSYAAMDANHVPHSASAANWVLTYSPDYVVSFWYGVDKLGEKSYTDAIAAAVQRKLISAIIADKVYPRNSKFTRPAGVITAKYERETMPAQLPSGYTPGELVSTELFKKGTEPSEISERFTQLSNPSNGRAEVSNSQINLSWNPIATPNAISETYLQNYFKENYGQFASMYLERRYNYNNNYIGTVGYQVSVVNESGEQVLGFTQNPYFVYNAPYNGNYNFIVRSSYSIFKANMSPGITIKATVTHGVDPEPEKPEEEDKDKDKEKDKDKDKEDIVIETP